MKIISAAPSRISLFGGGTDVDPYAFLYGGKVINLAINLRSHVELSTGDDLWMTSSNQFPYDADPKLFYEILAKYGLGGMHHSRVFSSFDGIIGAGLGSSASASVALISAINKYNNLNLSKDDIAKEAWNIEVNILGWHGGKQDQYASSYGGLNYIEFDEKVKVYPVERDKADILLAWMVLFYLGGTRDSRKIQNGFKKLNKRQKKVLDKIKHSVVTARVWIEVGYVEGIAKYLNEMWQFKKESNKGVSNTRIDYIYDVGLENGALGGKILGAGGGGYMLFMCPPNKQKNLISALKKQGIEKIDFSIDWNGCEVRII